MLNPILTKNYTAGAAIAAYTIVKHGAADGVVLPAAAAADLSIGVSTSLPAANGERVDVIRSGVAEVIYGAAVTRGQELTADASGRAIPAAPAAGANVRVIGIAEQSGVLGDIGSMLLAQSVKQG